MADPAEELLTGLSGETRKQRAELVDWLLEQGFTVEQIGAAIAPVLMPAGRLIGSEDGDYVSTRQIADEYGIDVDLLQRVQRAVGVVTVADLDAPVHLRADGAAAARLRGFVDAGLRDDDIVQVTRVLAEGLSRAAEVMRSAALAAVLKGGGTELEIAQRSEQLVGRIVPLLGPWITDMLFTHLRHQLETEAVTAGEIASGHALPGARNVFVAFADLVGFTRFGEEVPPGELEQLANRLGNLAREVAVPPVRFIKTIGDAVMLVSTEVQPLVRAMLILVDVAESDTDFLRLRAGVASGPAVCRAGDWFGNPVNLASRITGVARAGSVLVAESVREAADEEEFRWSYAGARHLKGISGETKLFRVRHVTKSV